MGEVKDMYRSMYGNVETTKMRAKIVYKRGRGKVRPGSNQKSAGTGQVKRM